MQTTTPWTPPEPVTRQLSTKEGFLKAVAPASALTGGATGTLVVGVLLLAYNVINTFVTLNRYDAPTSLFWDVFFSTESTSSSVDPKLAVTVWGPVVLIPLGLLLLLLATATRRSRHDSAFDAFSRGGYVTKALGLPFRFTAGRAVAVPQVLVPAHLGTPDVAEWMSGLAQTLAALDKKATKSLAKTLTKKLAQDGVAVPAADVFPGAPPFALLVPAPDAVGAETVRAVVPGKTVRAYVVNLEKVSGWGVPAI